MSKQPAGKFDHLPKLIRGMCFEEMEVGFGFRTSSRTITETDLVNFVTLAGFTEPLFTDARGSIEMGYRDRLIPGALVYCVGEGLVIQSHSFHGTGIAFLQMELVFLAPTFVGDTLQVAVEIMESRASKNPERGVVKSKNTIFNQDGVTVAWYDATRLVKGKQATTQV